MTADYMEFHLKWLLICIIRYVYKKRKKLL